MKPLVCFFCIAVFIFSCKKSNHDGSAGDLLPQSLETSFLRVDYNISFQSICFVNSATGFIGGTKGEIYKTVDSGLTWTPQNSTVDLPVYGLYFLNDQKGFAVGGRNSCGGSGCTPPGAFILETTNGGQTWDRVYTPTDKIELSSVYFVNASTGFAVGDNVIVKTTDGGATWSEYKINDLGGKMMQVLFTDTQKGYVVSLFDKIVETTDGGVTWKVTSTQRNIGYYSISASGGSIYVSGQGTMIKSTDAGGSWTDLPKSPSDVYAIYFIDAKKGFAFGRGQYSAGDFGHYYGLMYLTNDGGNSWNGSDKVTDIGMITGVSFPTSTVGYAIGGNEVLRIKIH